MLDGAPAIFTPVNFNYSIYISNLFCIQHIPNEKSGLHQAWKRTKSERTRTMTRTDIIKELEKRGYKAEKFETVKNGVTFEGIRIKTDTGIDPIIYCTEEFLKDAEEAGGTLEDVTHEIIGLYEERKRPDLDVRQLLERDYFLKHLQIGLQRASTQDVVKKNLDEFEGIEEYLYISQEGKNGCIAFLKVSEQLLDRVRVSEDEAWKRATENTCEETTIVSLGEAISEVMGFEYDEKMDEEEPFYIISNKCGIQGASAVLNRQALETFAEYNNVNKLVVLPSSIHEMLLIPCREGVNLSDYSDMVARINRTGVKPEERLTDRAYIIEV